MSTLTLHTVLSDLCYASIRNDEVPAGFRPFLLSAQRQGLAELRIFSPIARWYITEAGGCWLEHASDGVRCLFDNSEVNLLTRALGLLLEVAEFSPEDRVDPEAVRALRVKVARLAQEG